MSDVHANPAALKDAHVQGCGRFVMLGDTTGYGYDVKEAIKLVRSEFDIVLMGNHDSACLGREPAWETETNPHYHQDQRQSHLLSEREAAWLGKRPYLHFEAGAAFSEAEIVDVDVDGNKWDYTIKAETIVLTKEQLNGRDHKSVRFVRFVCANRLRLTVKAEFHSQVKVTGECTYILEKTKPSS